jgi:hypothetical protein
LELTDWILSKEKDNRSLRYKLEEGNGIITTKGECIVETSITNLIFFFREVEFFAQI